jgi:hypothetical protein
VNEPVVGHWYLNMGMPLYNPQRMMVFKIRGLGVYLTDDPRTLMPGETPSFVVWEIEAFRDFFRACEDLSKSVVLGPCPDTCPTCFAPAIKRVVRRVMRNYEREEARKSALQELRRRVARKLRQKGARPLMDQVIQTRKVR